MEHSACSERRISSGPGNLNVLGERKCLEYLVPYALLVLSVCLLSCELKHHLRITVILHRMVHAFFDG